MNTIHVHIARGREGRMIERIDGPAIFTNYVWETALFFHDTDSDNISKITDEVNGLVPNGWQLEYWEYAKTEGRLGFSRDGALSFYKHGNNKLGGYEVGMLIKAELNIYPTKMQRGVLSELGVRGYIEPNEPKYPARWRLTAQGAKVLSDLKELSEWAFNGVTALWCGGVQ